MRVRIDISLPSIKVLMSRLNKVQIRMKNKDKARIKFLKIQVRSSEKVQANKTRI